MISLIDGRPELTTDVRNSPVELKQYLANELKKLLSTLAFIQALPGHLNYNEKYNTRQSIVIERINNIVDLGKHDDN